jgi:hypothetical protein
MHGQARLRHLLDGHISSSREQAMREAAPHYEENMKMFGELRLVRALSDAQIAAMRAPRLAGTVKLPTIEDTVKAGGSLAGRPEDIFEQLKAVPASTAGARAPPLSPRGTSMRDPRVFELARTANLD